MGPSSATNPTNVRLRRSSTPSTSRRIHWPGACAANSRWVPSPIQMPGLPGCQPGIGTTSSW